MIKATSYMDRDGNLLKPGMILRSNGGRKEKVVRLINGELGFFRSPYWGATLKDCYTISQCGTVILIDYRLVGGEYQ